MARKASSRYSLNPREQRWHILQESGWAARLKLRNLRVLMAIMRHLDADGKAWPSIKRISQISGVRFDHASKSIQKLETDGLIHATRGGGRGRRTEYQISDEVLRRGPGTKKQSTVRRKQPTNRGPKPSTDCGPKPSTNRGRVKRNSKDPKRKKHIETLDPSLLSVLKSHDSAIEMMAGGLRISDDLIRNAESRLEGALGAALAITRLAHENGSLTKSPGAYCTALLKRISAKGREGLTRHVDDALDHFLQLVGDDQLVNLTDETEVETLARRWSEFQRLIETELDGELRRHARKLLSGDAHIDWPHSDCVEVVTDIRKTLGKDTLRPYRDLLRQLETAS